MSKKFTHICIFSDNRDSGPCHKVLSLCKAKGKHSWITTKAIDHLKHEHPDSKAALEAAARSKKASESKTATMFAFSVATPITGKKYIVGKAAASQHEDERTSPFVLTKRERELSSQVTWYIYGNQRISKRTFEDPYFRRMMTVSGTQNMMNRANLLKWVRAEYEIFLLYLRFLIKKALDFAYGNPFAQFIHDGGTLANKDKYQTGGLQFI